MIQVDNPVQLAEELRKLGLSASHEIVYGPRGYQEGLEVGDEFFPMWELRFPKTSKRSRFWILARSKLAAAGSGQ